MKVSTVCAKAAKLIEERGLAKAVLVDREGRLCINGAVNLVLNGDPHIWGDLDSPARRFLAARPTIVRGRYYDVAVWNNRPKTTKSQVVGFLRRAAAAAKRQGI